MNYPTAKQQGSKGFRDFRQPNILIEKTVDMMPSKALIRMQHELAFIKLGVTSARLLRLNNTALCDGVKITVVEFFDIAKGFRHDSLE
jgi:hypothetical protein